MESLNELNNWARLYLPSPLSTLALTLGMLCLLVAVRKLRASWEQWMPLLMGGLGLGFLVFGLLLYAAHLTSRSPEMQAIWQQGQAQLHYFYSTPFRGLLSIVFLLAGFLGLLLATNTVAQFHLGTRAVVAPQQTRTRLMGSAVGMLLLAVGMFLAFAAPGSTMGIPKRPGVFRQLEDVASNLLKTPFSVATFMLGVYLLLVAAGIAIGFQIGGVSVPAPQTERGKNLVRAAGAALLAVSVIVAFVQPAYKTTVSARLIYSGKKAEQVIADGEDVYLLHGEGNIHRILDMAFESVDPGTGTRQIAAAGGVVYVLKKNGEVWAISVASKSYQPIPVWRQVKVIQPCWETEQIATAGEILYFLTKQGNIYKYFVCPLDPDNYPHCTQTDNVVLVDPGTGTKQIASSGSVLYVLKNNGSIWQYAASVAEGHPESCPLQQNCFTRIYPLVGREALPADQEAIDIIADGGTLYFTTSSGSVWRFRRGLALIKDGASSIAKKLTAVGGILYILTTEGDIWRYNAKTDNLRHIVEAGKENVDIAAYGQEFFAIDKHKNVWRYSEVALVH
jgi:hypothetical protein